ncbi:class I SAM-dependent methyltransferase [Humidesulfovibrio sp.]
MTKSTPQSVRDYYDAIIAKHGPVPNGVGWRDKESQYIKFEQLYRIISQPDTPCTINELGCGYGAFVDFLEEKGAKAEYRGYDISAPMLEAARRHLMAFKRAIPWSLHLNEEMQTADYIVASGIFNANMGPGDSVVEKEEWEQYILSNLHEMNKRSRLGFSFNMQTIYSDFFTKYYYGDPCFYFDYCMKNFSNQVALLHNYKLFDFTILVSKGRQG